MSVNMSAKIFWTIVITGGLGGAWAAQAQVGSPFANKKKRQAWETAAPTPPPNPVSTQTHTQQPVQPQTYAPPQTTYQAEPAYQPQPSYALPSAYQSPTYQSPAYNSPANSSAPAQTLPSYYQPQTPPPPATRSPFAPKTTPQYHNSPPPSQAQTYPPQSYGNPTYQGQTYPQQSYQGQSYQGQPEQNQYYQQGSAANAQARFPGNSPQPPKRSWSERLGFGNLATSLKGFFKIGAAAVRRESDVTGINQWDDGYIGDAQIRGEVSAITDGGLEYGIGGLVRGQYDEFRRGFGGLVGDCPPGIAGCASVDVNGTPTAVRGHTSRFFTSGTSDAQEFEFALEGAYAFLRSSYGDISIGRDDGAAYLFSLGAPSLVAVNASNSSVDYTGLDSVKTVNDASGFSEKIVYTSPRLLGDRIGVGVQVGASYALNARSCGVDFCVRENGEDGTGALAPDLDDVFEFGISLDRTFQNGLSVEATGTYARASEQSSLAAFDDLQSFGAGLEFEWNDFTLGGSWLNSNNGLVDGDYTAWDVGLSWKPSQWGASISYGHATDDNIGLTSDQITFGTVYDVSERLSFGTGVQYVDRTVPVAVGTAVTDADERGIGLFVEGKVTF